MKKSECFKIAQIAVLRNQSIEAEEKLEIIRVLMSEEDIARLVEKREETVESGEVCEGA